MAASNHTLEPLCQIATPTGMVGYGFNEADLFETLSALKADGLPLAVICDSGSTDGGPRKLALGSMTSPTAAYVKDLGQLLNASLKFNVPVLVSSAGGDGSDEHVDLFLEILKECAASVALEDFTRNLNVIAVYSGVSKEIVLERLENGQVAGCGPSVPALRVEDVTSSPRILAQIGPEAILEALVSNPNFDIVVAGRAYDPSLYVAFIAFVALRNKPPRLDSLTPGQVGGFTHAGKILECGGICAEPKSKGAIAKMYRDGSFDIYPQAPSAKCSSLSVAAHTFYEKSRPDILHGPGGYLDLTEATYEQLPDNRTVRVRSSKFMFSTAQGLPYTVKLEAARTIGYRSVLTGVFRDPILIYQIDTFLAIVKRYVNLCNPQLEGTFSLDFHIIGRDNESERGIAREVCIIGEALAQTQEDASTIIHDARIACTHGPYPGQKATSGNFAFGLGGLPQIDTGLCAEFSVYHVMNLSRGEELSSSSVEDIRPKGRKGDGVRPLFSWTAQSIHANPDNTNKKIGYEQQTDSNQARIKRTIEEQKAIRALLSQDVDLSFLKGTLGEIAHVVRSKNSGPYEMTLDVLFRDENIYRRVKDSKMLNEGVISALYDIPESEIIWCGFFDPALGFKATLPRKRKGHARASGGYMEDDVHASTHHVPLLLLPLPSEW